MEQYFIIENEIRKGPFSFESILEMNLSESTLVWKKGMKDWTQLNKLPEFKKSIPPPIPKTEEPVKIKEEEVHEEDNKIIVSNEFVYDSIDDAELNLVKHNNAGFWLRLGAFAIDYAILFFIYSSLWAFLFIPIPVDANNLFSSHFLVFKSPFFILFNWLYYTLFECSEFQATPGKKILGLQVTDERHKRIGFGQATGRYFGKFVSALFGIGFIMIAFTKQNQGLHDRMAKTYVIIENESDFIRKMSSWIILLVTILLFVVSAFIPGNTELIDARKSLLEKFSATSTSEVTPSLLNVSYGAVSFDYPDDWKVEKKEMRPDIFYLISCEKKEVSSSDFYGIMWLIMETDPSEMIRMTINGWKEDSTYKNIKTKPLNQTNYKGYDALSSDFNIDYLGVNYFGNITSFKAKGKTFLIFKIANKIEKLESEFSIIESSLKIE